MGESLEADADVVLDEDPPVAAPCRLADAPAVAEAIGAQRRLLEFCHFRAREFLAQRC